MDVVVTNPVTDLGGEGNSPLLAIGSFSGRLETLLALARIHQIDIAPLSLADLVAQLTGALNDASGRTPLGQQGDWVVMATWLVLLRSRLLLPTHDATQDTATEEAAQLYQGLIQLGKLQAAARWLDARFQLGYDVFPRGQPEFLGTEATLSHQVDVVAFLWASLALFDDDLPDPDTAARYRPLWVDLHAIVDAQERILRLMADHQPPRSLDQLLPGLLGFGAPPEGRLRLRSRWTSTFAASLELAKQGKVVLEQDTAFSPIHVACAAMQSCH